MTSVAKRVSAPLRRKRFRSPKDKSLHDLKYLVEIFSDLQRSDLYPKRGDYNRKTIYVFILFFISYTEPHFTRSS